MQLNPITVTDLNKYIKDKFASDETLANVLVKGEISNFKHHYTGHMYFTLKDEGSLIKCVMFKTSTSNLKFVPKDGMNVLVFGTVSVFERDGSYQIYCKAMQEDGMGNLYTAYEKLKEKLQLEGLFAQAHKKKIPFMPKTVGILTSQTGSVVRDIINVSTRRNPNVYLKILPVPVQGIGASEKIARAIKLMNEKNLVDVIIIARGGGSLEDLWPFNEEVTARAIYESKIPIISAIGHETDFTISDFVADLRAPTPSAAAELAVPDIEEVKLKLLNFNKRFKMVLHKRIELMRMRYERAMASRAFKQPLQRINESYIKVDMHIKTLESLSLNNLNDKKLIASKFINKLDALSPLKTLTRGYCLTESSSGKIIKEAKELKENDEISIRFIDGQKKARVI